MDQFIQQNKKDWESLDLLLNKIQRRGIKSLSTHEIQELSALYRVTSSCLSQAKRDYGYGRLVDYLNGLVGRAHSAIYRTRSPKLRNILNFYRYEFPFLFRSTIPYTLLSLLTFFIFTVLGYIMVIIDHSFPCSILPDHIVDSIERREMWTHSINTIKPLASTLIMTNNISVTLAAFSLGIFFGLGTFYILLLNGLLLGVVISACVANDMIYKLLSFIIPHGAIELSCIFIAGGAGFLLGSSFIKPGEVSRKDALVINGKVAVRLILGCIPWLVLAGIVEGFISPSLIPPFLKIPLGIILWIGMVSYLMFSKGKPP